LERRHVELARALLGIVASEAVFFEDRPDFVDEADRLLLGASDRHRENQPGRQGRQCGAEDAQTVTSQTHGSWPLSEGHARRDQLSLRAWGIDRNWTNDE